MIIQKPIISYGIIVFDIPEHKKQKKDWTLIRNNNNKIKNNTKQKDNISSDDIKFLLICRKHTFGFVEFVRGKYNFTNYKFVYMFQLRLNILLFSRKISQLSLVLISH